MFFKPKSENKNLNAKFEALQGDLMHFLTKEKNISFFGNIVFYTLVIDRLNTFDNEYNKAGMTSVEKNAVFNQCRLFVQTFKNCLNEDNQSNTDKHIKHYKTSYKDMLICKSTVVVALGILGAVAGVAAAVVFLPLGLNMISMSFLAIMLGAVNLNPQIEAKKQDVELFKIGMGIVKNINSEELKNTEETPRIGLN